MLPLNDLQRSKGIWKHGRYFHLDWPEYSTKPEARHNKSRWNLLNFYRIVTQILHYVEAISWCRYPKWLSVSEWVRSLWLKDMLDCQGAELLMAAPAMIELVAFNHRNNLSLCHFWCSKFKSKYVSTLSICRQSVHFCKLLCNLILAAYSR